MTTPTTHHNYWLHIQDKNPHESQLNNRFLYLTGSNFRLEPVYGSYESFIRDHARMLRRELSADEAAANAHQRTADRAAGMPDDPDKINAGPGPLTKEEKTNLDIVQVSENGGGGNSADYLTRRIARDRPDILKRMKAGEYQSVRAAALEAGIVQRTQTVRVDDPHSTARTLRRHMTPDNITVLAKLLTQAD